MPRSFSIALAMAFAAMPALLLSTLSASVDDLTFTGTTESGGVIQITTTVDRAGITRLALEDVPLNCEESPPSPVSKIAYFSPPVLVIDGTFRLSVSSRTSVQSGPSLTVLGEFVGSSAAEGNVQFSEPFGCETALSWQITETTDTPPASDDFTYTGVIGSSALMVTTDAQRAGITSLTLTGLTVPGCAGPGGTQFDVPGMQLELTAFFEPPQLVPTFQIGDTHWQTTAEVETTSIDNDAVEGTLTIATSAYTTECAHEFDWQAALVTPSVATPAAQLPGTGFGSHAASGPSGTTIASLLMAGLILLGLATASRGRTAR